MPKPHSKREQLTKAQEAFCQAYVLNSGNGVEAYRAAYPDTQASADGTVAAMASKLLKVAKVMQRIHALRQRVQAIADKKFDVTAESLIQEMAAIAFLNADDYYDWGMETVTDTRKDGTPYQRTYATMTLKSAKELTRTQKKAVAGIEKTVSRTGDVVVNLKLADKRAAIKDLYAMAGFTKPLELTGPGGEPIKLVITNAESAL